MFVCCTYNHISIQVHVYTNLYIQPIIALVAATAQVAFFYFDIYMLYIQTHEYICTYIRICIDSLSQLLLLQLLRQCFNSYICMLCMYIQTCISMQFYFDIGMLCMYIQTDMSIQFYSDVCMLCKYIQTYISKYFYSDICMLCIQTYISIQVHIYKSIYTPYPTSSDIFKRCFQSSKLKLVQASFHEKRPNRYIYTNLYVQPIPLLVTFSNAVSRDQSSSSCRSLFTKTDLHELQNSRSESLQVSLPYLTEERPI